MTARKVLLVDDNLDALETMQMLLELQGYEVRALSSAREAIQVGPAYHPHVCVLDIGLPEFDGYQLARALREGGLADARFVALSGFSEQDRKSGDEGGRFDLHLTKPVQIDALLGALG
jgi:CheY-like chemotaxis protein